MKNKKIPAILLGIACVAILIGAISLNRKAEPEFIPEATEPTVSDSWEEKRTQDSQVQTELQETEPQSPGASGSADDATQTVVTEEPQQVVTELTQPVKKSRYRQIPYRTPRLQTRRKTGGFLLVTEQKAKR